MEVFSVPLPDLPIPKVNYELSFEPYYRYIKEQISSTKSDIYKTYLESIASLFEKSPELLQPVTDLKKLENYRELLELVKITHFSQVEGESDMHTLGMPSSDSDVMNNFGASIEYKNFFKDRMDALVLHTDIDYEQLHRDIYIEILAKCYGVYDETELPPQTALQLVDNEGGIKRYYRIIRRNNFIDVVVEGELPEFRQEWLDYANKVIRSHEDIEVPIPSEKFTTRGFFMFSAIEDTENMALRELSYTVAQIHTFDPDESIKRIKETALSLLGNDKLEVGILPFIKVNDDYVYHEAFSEISIVFGRLTEHLSFDELTGVFSYIANMCDDLPDILSSLNNNLYDRSVECADESSTKDALKKEGLQSLSFIPIRHHGKLLGIIEIGSMEPGQIDNSLLRKLELAEPLFREFLLNRTSFFDEYMRMFIMQRYTSIQPSVFWKFKEEVWHALKYAHTEEEGMKVKTPSVKFENLDPFYGAIDFRNSSVKQLQAIHSDYLLQLDYLKTLILDDNILDNTEVKAFVAQIEDWEQKVHTNMDIDEYELRQFLDIASIDFLKTLVSEGFLDRDIYESYKKNALSKEGIFHLSHNDYEESLQHMNGVLKEELNKAEDELQKTVPHYFEKFQTDGFEYSLYAGNSIAPEQDYPNNAKDIIASWQVETMLKLAKAAAEHKSELSIPLETTQLILIHENKVDISYRIDEKHFDVEGSYSIRYEVVKKRIDKVKLLNSNERLTQPGTIAIVYAHKREAKPYLDKVNSLISDGELHGNIEYLDLEQLQGVGKLKAIRVTINTNKKKSAQPNVTSHTA